MSLECMFGISGTFWNKKSGDCLRSRSILLGFESSPFAFLIDHKPQYWSLGKIFKCRISAILQMGKPVVVSNLVLCFEDNLAVKFKGILKNYLKK